MVSQQQYFQTQLSHKQHPINTPIGLACCYGILMKQDNLHCIMGRLTKCCPGNTPVTSLKAGGLGTRCL